MNASAQILITELRDIFQQPPDPKTCSKRNDPVSDAAMAAFSLFFMQSPSFLERQQRYQGEQNSAVSLFGLDSIPTDNHIRQ